jgi:hypothetical protein
MAVPSAWASVTRARWRGAVDRGDGGVEQAGDLLGRPGEHVTQDQHRALGARQQLERGDEGQRDALPPVDDGSRVVVGAGEPVEQRVRVGLQPGHVDGGGDRVAGPPVDHFEAGGGRDPVEPVPQRRPSLVSAQSLPGPQQRLLHRLLGVVV